jgi:hypothetical protein
VRRRRDWFESQPDLDASRLVFIDETGLSTKMARLRGRALRGERCRAGIPHGHVWTPLRMQEDSLVQVAACDRVLPCVRPLLRRRFDRRPVWECEGRDHITGTRSKRSPCAWFSRPRLTDVAPYLFL